MSQGFINNAAAVAGITNAWDSAKGIALKADLTADPKARDMPQGCFLSHLVVKADETVATCATLQAALTWDAEGNDLLAGPTSAAAVFDGLTDTSLRMVSFKLDSWVTAPSDQTTIQTVYLWLQTDAGTVTVPVNGAQLFWSNPATRP
jgi:hypothetical protein